MLSVLVIAAAAATIAVPAGHCRQVHYAGDGTVTEAIVVDTNGGHAQVATSGRGTRSASSSVSASSSSSAGTSTSRSSVVVNGRESTVSVTRDKTGCTIVIDGRQPNGEQP